MFNFPTPTFVGQKYQPAAGMPVYGWDGVKWTTLNLANMTDAAPSSADPQMDGAASIGTSVLYARGDHVHPTDSSRAAINNTNFTGTLTAALLSVSGNVTVNGKLTSTAKQHRFGSAVGTGAGGAVTPADANLKLYDHTGGTPGGSWCGIGTDVNGHFWIRTGYSGSPAPVMYIQSDQFAVFRDSPTCNTPTAGDNSTRIATTEFVKSRSGGGSYFPLNASATIVGSVTVALADLWVYALQTNAGNYGVLYLGNTGSRYLIWDGSNYSLSGAHSYGTNGRMWGTNDFGFPWLSSRLVYVGDYNHVRSTGPITEPFGGSAVSGMSGSAGGPSISWTKRYRQFQYYTTSWFAIAYA